MGLLDSQECKQALEFTVDDPEWLHITTLKSLKYGNCYTRDIGKFKLVSSWLWSLLTCVDFPSPSLDKFFQLSQQENRNLKTGKISFLNCFRDDVKTKYIMSLKASTLNV